MLNFIQRGMMRRQIARFLDDADLRGALTFPLHAAIMEELKAIKEEDVTPEAMAGSGLEAMASRVAGKLVAHGHVDAVTGYSGPFLDMLLALFKTLLPMLIGCLVSTPTPAQVVAFLQ